MKYGLVKNLVNGRFVEAGNGATIEVTNPATDGEVVGAVPAMGRADVDTVFAAARAGARTWKAAGQLARGRTLINAADAIRQRQDELIDVVVTEMGKTKAEATGEVGKTAEFFEYYGSMARLPFGEYLADGRPGTFASQLREPVGVALLITPWNDPSLTPARKMAPALLAGNAVIIKPATVTPIITLKLAEILNDAGLPAGVLGTITGRGSEIGDYLFESSEIDAVSFTGSTEVGIGIEKKLAGTGVRVQTEMGGKNAAVILDDADLDTAVSTIAAGAFAQAGQRCTATSRLIVQRGIEAEVTERISNAVESLKVAAGLVDGADLGPVVSKDAQQDITRHIEKAVGEGAKVLATATLSDEAQRIGCFVNPTFLKIDRDHAIWRDEVFGPVLAMVVVDTLDEAIEAVNDSAYGLASSIFTKDLGAAYRFVEDVDTGQVSVNQPTTGWDIHHPFGGFKDSGSAHKEQGLVSLEFYTRVKTAAIKTH